MGKGFVVLGVLGVAAWLAAAFLFGFFVLGPLGADSTPTPTHVVAVYVDGLNHLDFRETCSTITAPTAFPSQAACEVYFSFNSAVAGPQRYSVVSHSVKVWVQRYQGRDVKLAAVKYRNASSGQVLTAHLRFIKGAWKIVGVS